MTYKLILFCAGLGFASLAQGSDLTVASAIVGPGGSASLGLGLAVAGVAPAGLQWTVGYSPAQISAMSITVGPASSAAGKTLSCAAASGVATCLVAGLNRNPLGSGNVALLNATLAPGVTAAAIQITRPVGVDPGGNGLNFTSVTGGSLGTPALSSLTCSPSALSAGVKSTCTVTLTQAAPAGGLAVGLASNNGLLTVPASITVPAAGRTATFSAIAASTIASSQSAVVKATLNGASQSATLTLVPAILLSAITCNPASLGSGAVSVCTVTLTGPAPAGGSQVALASNSGLLTVPPSITVPAGAALTTFNAKAGAIASSQTAIVTATFGAATRTATISLKPSILLSGLTCTPATLGPGASTTCTAVLNAAATGNGISVTLQSNNSFLTVPASATIPAGAATGKFSAKAGAFRTSQTAVVTASLNGGSATASLSLSTKPKGQSRGQVSSLSCPSESITPGSVMTCELQVTDASQAVPVELTSSSGQVYVPAVVTTRPNQSSLTFQAESSPLASAQAFTLTATLGGTDAATTLRAIAAAAPVVQAPAKQVTRAGAPISFQVSAADASDLPLQVDAGLPVLNAPAALCSPGAIARLNGKWLAAPGSQPSDPSGTSLSLGGTSVAIGGQAVPVLYSSANRVDFLCPVLAAGTEFSIQATSGFRVTQPVKTTMREALPTILTLQGQDQGLIFFEGMNDLAMERNFRVPSHPAQPGDRLVIHATGIGTAASLPPGALMVKLSDVYAVADSVDPVPGYAGVYAIHVRVPAAMTFGAVPVQLQLTMPGGTRIDGNSVTAFFEAVR